VSRRSAVVQLALGGAVLGVTTVRALRPQPSQLELDCFEAVNSLPDGISAPLWPVMQLGALAAVPAVAGVVWWRGARGRAIHLLVSGSATWVVAKGVKRLVRRGRPAAVVEAARIRGLEQSGDGFISGHAAISAALAAGARPLVPGATPVLAGLAATVGFARLYVGAHLPLDVVGGAATGLIVDAVLELARPT
jgi:glycosyltransferase 2 family protein